MSTKVPSSSTGASSWSWVICLDRDEGDEILTGIGASQVVGGVLGGGIGV